MKKLFAAVVVVVLMATACSGSLEIPSKPVSAIPTEIDEFIFLKDEPTTLFGFPAVDSFLWQVGGDEILFSDIRETVFYPRCFGIMQQCGNLRVSSVGQANLLLLRPGANIGYYNGKQPEDEIATVGDVSNLLSVIEALTGRVEALEKEIDQ